MYKTLQESDDSYERCKSLITILKDDFGDDEIIYLDSPIDEAKDEILKCFNSIFEHFSWLNHIHQDDKIYHFYRMSIFNNTDDEFYKHLIDFGGFNQVLEQGNDILSASIILLDNSNEDHIIRCYNIEQEHLAYDIIREAIECLKNDDFFEEENQEINDIIDQYWGNTISFAYDEYINNLRSDEYVE